MNIDFTPKAYTELLEAFTGRRYEMVEFAHTEPNKRHLLLRHDMDMSIEAALPVAKIERGLGYCA